MKRWLLLLLFGFSVVATSYPQEVGEGLLLYQTHCASCHGEDRAGKVAPPLFSLFLKKYSDKKLTYIIKNGITASQMPAFKNLSNSEIRQIIAYIRQPAKLDWDINKIIKSREINKEKGKDLNIKNLKNIVAVVERGKNKVWIMEELNILDKFDFKNVHGGLKFSPSGTSIYIPSRDGWVGRYDLDRGRFFGKIRSCVYLRNISLDRSGKFILVSCWVPKSIVVLDGESFEPIKIIKQEGLISAVYELYTKDEAVFTFKDKPLIGFLDTKKLNIRFEKLKEPYEDFFLDPFEKYIIGTSRKGTVLSVYSLDKKKEIFSYKIEGMPHLSSATYWYNNGKFYFATPHMTLPYITVWEMYNWKFVRKVGTDGNGFFVRTHPSTPYLWTDNGKDKVVLIDKNGFSVKKIETIKGKRVIHTEFSGDGRYAYVSLYNRDGHLLIYDSITLKLLKDIPASIPIGKYNIVNKSRRFSPMLLGREVFIKKCWGCHHETQEAFAPSFKWIVENRDVSTIKAHILNPEGMYKALGYERNAMPQLNLSEWELNAVVSYMMEFKNAENNRVY